MEEIPHRTSYSKEDYIQKQKVQHSYKIWKWNARTLEKGGSVLGISEVWWDGKGEISGGYTTYYSGSENVQHGVQIMVHKSIMSTDKKNVSWQQYYS